MLQTSSSCYIRILQKVYIPLISGEVWYFFDLTHLPLEEFLGCMLVVEVPGV